MSAEQAAGAGAAAAAAPELSDEDREKVELYGQIESMGVGFLGKYALLGESLSAHSAALWTTTAARMATLASLLKMNFDTVVFAGFYIVEPPENASKEPRLVVGPYQGDLLACAGIEWGKGVCGSSAKSGETLIVDDVSKFPGYIACDTETKSEIVVPVHNASGELIAVLDIDGYEEGAFNEVDKTHLERLCKLFFG